MDKSTLIYIKFIGIYLACSIAAGIVVGVIGSNFFLLSSGVFTLVFGFGISLFSSAYLGGAFVRLTQNPLTLLRKLQIAGTASMIFIIPALVIAAFTIEPAEGLTFSFFALGMLAILVVNFVIFFCGINIGAKEATDKMLMSMLKNKPDQ